MSIIRGPRTYGSARPPSALAAPGKSAVIGKVEGKVPFRGFLLLGLAAVAFVSYLKLAERADDIIVAVEGISSKLENLEELGLPPQLEQVISDLRDEISGSRADGREGTATQGRADDPAAVVPEIDPVSAAQGGAAESKALDGAYEQGRSLANAGKFGAALSVWRPLAEKGHAESIFSIGRLHARGDGVPKDFRKAREQFLRAAQLGSASAYHALGLMYLNGDGVSRDTVKAKTYFQEAARRGHSGAKSALSSLGKR